MFCQMLCICSMHVIQSELLYHISLRATVSLMIALQHDLTRSFEKLLRAVWLISRLVPNYNTLFIKWPGLPAHLMLCFHLILAQGSAVWQERAYK